MHKVVEQLLQLAEQNPRGLRIRMPDLVRIYSGWGVPLEEEKIRYGKGGCKKVVEAAIKKDYAVSGWRFGDKFWWRVIMVFESEQEAVSACRLLNQEAIINLETNREKRLYLYP